MTAGDDRLRELAQAVRGERTWAARMEPVENPVAGGPEGRWWVVSAREEYGYPVETLCVLNFEHPYGDERRTAEYIAAASPDMVLGLLDRLAAVGDSPSVTISPVWTISVSDMGDDEPEGGYPRHFSVVVEGMVEEEDA